MDEEAEIEARRAAAHAEDLRLEAENAQKQEVERQKKLAYIAKQFNHAPIETHAEERLRIAHEAAAGKARVFALKEKAEKLGIKV